MTDHVTNLMQQHRMQKPKKKQAKKTKKPLSIISQIKTHKMKICFALFILFAVCASSSLFAFPLHASCKLDWQFSISCEKVKATLVKQIKTWTGEAGCKNGGEKCLYSLRSESTAQVLATHETPVKHYKDDLTFNFKPNNTQCAVHGHSTSETWYAVLDYGTNYCNLRNLLTGSGLNSTKGFVEKTSNSICTQYSSADCEKY